MLNTDAISWLIKKTSETFDSDINLLDSKSRNKELVFTRMVVWSILKKHSELSLYKLGSIFIKHHSTVLHGLKVCQNIRDTDKHFNELYDSINNQFVNKFFSGTTDMMYPELKKKMFEGENIPIRIAAQFLLGV